MSLIVKLSEVELYLHFFSFFPLSQLDLDLSSSSDPRPLANILGNASIKDLGP